MPKYRIERTELHTRVWYIEAEDEDQALENYIEEEEHEEHSYHHGEVETLILLEQE